MKVELLDTFGNDNMVCNVAGLNLFVTPNTAAGTDTDGSILIVNPDAYTW